MIQLVRARRRERPCPRRGPPRRKGDESGTETSVTVIWRDIIVQLEFGTGDKDREQGRSCPALFSSGRCR